MHPRIRIPKLRDMAPLATAFLLAVQAAPTAAQMGTAPTGDPGPGFGIDGDLDSNVPTASTTDWAWGAGAGAGIGLIENNGAPSAPNTLHGVDEYNNQDLIFRGGDARFTTNPNTDWRWDTPGMNPLGGKEDLGNGVAHFSRDAGGHTWFTWAVDREGGGGQSYIPVALYQGTLVRNGDGTFTSSGPHNGSTIGDLVLDLELLDLMTGLPILRVWRYTETSPGVYDLTALTPAGGTAFTGANTNGQVTVPYGAFGKSYYSPETFAEASIDLTALLAGVQPSATFRTVFFCNRSGDMIAATLRDFIDPMSTTIPVSVGDAPTARTAGRVTVSPNPATAAVTVEFEVARRGPVSVEIFDLAGRRVATLASETFAAGRHALRWDPAAARTERNGMLFARVAADGEIHTRRFIVLP